MNYKYISICIPVYNGEKFLEYTLNNIYLVKYPKEYFEVIVGNHSSNDNTENILKDYKTKYNNFNYINIPRTCENRPQARNNILKLTKGEIIIFIDQDILVNSNFIDEHYLIHKKYEKCIVAGYTFGKGDIRQMDEKVLHEINLNNITNEFDKLKSKHYLRDMRESFYNYIKLNDDITDLTEMITSYKVFWSCNISFKKADIDKLGNFDENFTNWGLEDDELTYRFVLNGYKMLFSNKAWTYHISHKVNTLRIHTTWRKNLTYFFKKYATRNLEFYSKFYTTTETEINSMQFYNDILPKDNNFINSFYQLSKKLPMPMGKRLGILMVDEKFGDYLSLSECFIPFSNINMLPYKKGNCRYWSLLGLNTPFIGKYFDEAILYVDLLILLEEHMMQNILFELARISKSLYLCYGALANSKDILYIRDKLNVMLEILNIEIIKY